MNSIHLAYALIIMTIGTSTIYSNHLDRVKFEKKTLFLSPGSLDKAFTSG